MADAAAEARIRDLKRRLELDPGSRLFVALAEEYRKSGRVAEGLSTLQKGLLAHPNYLSAQVALGRAYLEAGQITEAIATFSKTLAADPGNLVSARSLADIYLSRGESVEAVKKYKLYRAISGDKSVDATIERLEAELAPPPSLEASAAEQAPPPPPTFFDRKKTGPVRLDGDARFAPPVIRPVASSDSADETSVKFEPDDSFGKRTPSIPDPFAPISRDVPLAAVSHRTAPAPKSEATPAVSRVTPSARALAPAEPPAPRVSPEPAPLASPSASPSLSSEGSRDRPNAAAPSDSRGRVLADLYFAQGHYAEALRIYDELVAADPFDEDVKRMRRDAEARLLPASSTPGGDSADSSLQRRLGKIRVLKRWLSVVQTG